MATITYSPIIASFSGKLTKRTNGYCYVRNGRSFYRDRREGYQKNQSPKQLWRSHAFAYAQKQLAGPKTPDEQAALNAEWRAAKGITPFGKKAVTPQGWKRSALIYQWEQEHPFEQWYTDYLESISTAAAEITDASDISAYQIKKQIAALSAQLQALQDQLNAKK